MTIPQYVNKKINFEASFALRILAQGIHAGVQRVNPAVSYMKAIGYES